MPSIQIDDQRIDVEAGKTILDAARQVGLEIPTLCYLKGHPAQASCMLCVVRVIGRHRLVPACATAVEDGMVVESETEDVREARRTAIELLLSDHLGDCIAPCHSTCPAHIDIPLMLRHIAAGNMNSALMVAKESVALPAVLGYICPELCEKGCRRKAQDSAVSICMLKRYVAEEDLASDAPYVPPMKPSSGKKVAIVGAGPAGLSAAYYLLRHGHHPTLFDEHDSAGGMLRYGVLEKDLPRQVLDDEIALIAGMGAEFRLGVRVGREVPLEVLRSEFDAVLVAAGDLKEADAPSDDLERGPQGLKADRSTMMTSLAGVFLAGSTVVPAKHAVRAVGDGRLVADRIDRYLAGADLKGEPKEWSTHVGRLDAESVKPFVAFVSGEDRIETGPRGFMAEEARREALRCIQCGCVRPHQCQLRRFATEYEANPSAFRGERRVYEEDQTHPEIVFQSGKCIACGICVRIASQASEKLGLSFVGRGFTVRTAVPFTESLREGLRETARECAINCPTGALTLKEWRLDVPGEEE